MKIFTVAILSLLSLGTQVLSAPVAITTTQTLSSPLHKAVSTLYSSLQAELAALGSTPETGSKGSNVPEIADILEDIVHIIHTAGHEIKSVVNNRDAKEMTIEQLALLISDLDQVYNIARNTTYSCADAEGNYSPATVSLLDPKFVAVKAAIAPLVTPLITYATYVAETFIGAPELVSELKLAVAELKMLESTGTVTKAAKLAS